MANEIDLTELERAAERRLVQALEADPMLKRGDRIFFTIPSAGGPQEYMLSVNRRRKLHKEGGQIEEILEVDLMIAPGNEAWGDSTPVEGVHPLIYGNIIEPKVDGETTGLQDFARPWRRLNPEAFKGQPDMLLYEEN